LKHERATEEVRELAVLYALGSMTQHEARSFEIHLREGCSICESELRRFEHTVAGIGFAADETETPEYLRELLMARIEREEQNPDPERSPGSDAGKPVPESSRQLFSSLSPTPQSRRTADKRTSPLDWAIRIALVLLIVAGLWGAHRLISARSINATLLQKLSLSQADAESLQFMLDIQKSKAMRLDQILAVSGKPGVRVARMMGQPAAPTSSGLLYWDSEQSRCMLLGSFPPVPQGKTYQLWLISPSLKISAGMIQTSPTGPTLISVDVPKTEGASTASVALITVEPEGGSTTPTIPYGALGRFN